MAPSCTCMHLLQSAIFHPVAGCLDPFKHLLPACTLVTMYAHDIHWHDTPVNLPPQRIHGFEVMVTRKAEGKEGRAFIGSMTEEKSVELASKIASESFLFAVGDRLGLL